MDLELKNKVALITGGSAGIGLAVAEGLAREGAHVVLCARHETAVQREAARIAAAFNVTAYGLRCDVTRPDDIDQVVAAVNHTFGGADILINNAGEGTEEKILTAPDERWQYYWDLHVMSAVRFSRGIAPLMRLRGSGVIINNASICASQPLDHEPIYNVTKAALVMLSKCLANELIGDRIRVNSISPGLIQTAAWEDWAKRESAPDDWQARLKDFAREHAPIGRFASPAELADFFVFLCSPRASYCVGSNFYVDGGWLKVVV
ncbi:MAG: SDR family NAD(P)-dependent oxidoreductase [Blastocatellales bacterium]